MSPNVEMSYVDSLMEAGGDINTPYIAYENLAIFYDQNLTSRLTPPGSRPVGDITCL